ncbi:MAG TPA: dienelactone hydrolase family protein [Tepidisphaeraceae bacterium]|nr:dienelactone hydrolase family protein [Tepidisphaeraceae bacterium]
MKKLLLLIPTLLLGCSHPLPTPGTLTPQSLTTTTPHHVSYQYLLYLPPNYNPHQSYPLVLFLHGVGERGTDVSKVAAWGPPKLIAAGQQFNFILAAPQCPDHQWWHIDDLEVLLSSLLHDYPNIDHSRLYLTGLSMGGCATYDWILRDPHTFAAAAPICGSSNPTQVHYTSPLTPIWAFHGEADPVIPPDGSRLMVAAYLHDHAEAKLTLYPHLGHNAWTPAYNTPELYTWLLSHHLPH